MHHRTNERTNTLPEVSNELTRSMIDKHVANSPNVLSLEIFQFGGNLCIGSIAIKETLTLLMHSCFVFKLAVLGLFFIRLFTLLNNF